jgi:hypothetical protein
MPLYVYRCDECAARVEEFRSVDSREGGIHICATGKPVKHRTGALQRVFTPTQHGSIPGIYNRLNANWRETGKPIDVQHADVFAREQQTSSRSSE